MYQFNELQKIVNDEIDRRKNIINHKKPVQLYEPISYSLSVGGKRLRPVLLMMAYNIFCDDMKNVIPAAMAVEIFHNFTLLHDDIMDKADVRRNKPTVHVKFNENKAILSGDAMAFLSYHYLMECGSERIFEVMQVFTNTALEVCEGQQYDMDFEERVDVSEEQYLEMIRLKTAVLIGCSLKAGALLANASGNITDMLYEFGINIGMAFQLQDDWLDTFGDQKIFGKKIGGDIVANKKTYLLVRALEMAKEKQKNKLVYWIENKGAERKEKIMAVTEIYQSLKIDSIVKEKIKVYFDKAMKILDDLDVDKSKKVQLYSLCENMQKRSF